MPTEPNEMGADGAANPNKNIERRAFNGHHNQPLPPQESTPWAEKARPGVRSAPVGRNTKMKVPSDFVKGGGSPRGKW